MSQISLTEAKKILINDLVNTLTVNEAAALVTKIVQKNTSHNKSKRFGLYPIQDWHAFERAKTLEAAYWPADEITFTSDRDDFNSFIPEERRPLCMAFGFFAVGDGNIAQMLAYQMILTADTFEKQNFYVVQLNNERVHAEVYGKMIYTLITDKVERDNIFNSIENCRSIREMNEFIENSYTYPDGDRQLFVSLAASEYIMFTPLFCIIFWYRVYKPGKIPQVIFSNEQIAKDEATHCQNGSENYKELPSSKKYTDSEIHQFIDKIVVLVCNFADEMLENIYLPGLEIDMVKQYIRFVADDLLLRLGHSKMYNCEKGIEWMTFTELVPKTNFYENTVGEYARFSVKKSVAEAKNLCNPVTKKSKISSKIRF